MYTTSTIYTIKNIVQIYIENSGHKPQNIRMKTNMKRSRVITNKTNKGIQCEHRIVWKLLVFFLFVNICTDLAVPCRIDKVPPLALCVIVD